MKSVQDKSRQLIEAGGEVLGSSVAAAIGLLGGPVGSVTGAALGPVLVRVIIKICSEISDRQTGHRQKIRAGATAAFAILKLKEKLESGSQIREDGFFSENNSRSSAEEIFEGVMIKSHNEHEEKKMRYYANIFVTASFDSLFTPESLNHYLSQAERLTYRQLCLLQIFNLPRQYDLFEGEFDSDYLSKASFEKIGVLHEMYELYQLRLLKCKASGDSHADDYMAFDQIYPAWMFLDTLGQNLCHLMQLQSIPHEDLEKVAIYLTR